MIVLKFGGAALADATRGENTAKIIEESIPSGPVVVVSAMKDVTDILETWLREAVIAGRSTQQASPLATLREKHEYVLQELVGAPDVNEDLSRASTASDTV